MPDANTITAAPASQTVPASEQQALPVAEWITELVKPFSANEPAGSDASGLPEYFNLEMNFDSATPNYDNCVAWAKKILSETSKDLKVAAMLAFCLYRQKGLAGYDEGLSLIVSMLKAFGAAAFPKTPAAKTAAINKLLTTRFLAFLARENPSVAEKALVENILERLRAIEKDFAEAFAGNPPKLKKIADIFAPTLKALQEEEQKLKKEPDEKKPEEKKSAEKKSEEKTVGKESKDEESKGDSDDKRDGKIAASQLKVSSDGEAEMALRKIGLYYFQQEANGAKTPKAPSLPLSYAVTRAYAWSGLAALPQAENKIAKVDAPLPKRQSFLKERFDAKDWDALISACELDLMNQKYAAYWLDLQMWVAKGLEAKGTLFSRAKEVVLRETGLLLQRLPGLVELKFQDGATKFAEKETVAWLEGEVFPSMGAAGASKTPILPPLMGEEYDDINKEYEAACQRVPAEFDEVAKAMQAGMQGDLRRKGRFLRTLNLANLCLQSRQEQLAKILLEKLQQDIGAYQLEEWEPALCVAVWSSLYLTLARMLKSADEQASRPQLQPHLEELYTKITLYDCVRARNLLNEQS